MKAGFALSAALFAASAAVPRCLPGISLPPLGAPPVAAYAVQDMGAAMAGARRLGGDVAFVQLLQYLGTGGEHDHAPGEEHGHTDHYPDALSLSRRFVSLSPYFHGGILFSAGVLGFVLNRPAEAVSLLGDAARRDPSFWRYRLYAAAISYRTSTEPEKVIPLLEEALKYPDCPSMLVNILANLHKKRGDHRRAAEIYVHVIETSRDPDAVGHARRELGEILAEAGAR